MKKFKFMEGKRTFAEFFGLQRRFVAIISSLNVRSYDKLCGKHPVIFFCNVFF